MKVIVVGAGASGLPSLKTALEHGFKVRCMEMSDDLGGLWRFKEKPSQGEGTVMQNTVINTSKEMTAYSDFPPATDSANYMHNADLLAYFRRYAEHFDLLKHIKFRHKVLNVERCKNFSETGKWSVKYQNADGDLLTEVFDAVFACTGHHSIPYWPNPFPGQSQFKGRIMHSWSYHNGNEFAGKRVLVVGIGNSGSDIAVELSKIASKVYLSVRSGSWVMNKVWQYGQPADLALLTRFTYAIKRITPKRLQNCVIEGKLNRRFDHGRFGLRPAHRFTEAHVTMSDELPNRIISGTVVIKSNIASFTKHSVIFDDQTNIDNIDVVIFATGYSFSFPYIEEGKLVDVKDNKVTLYRLMFPPELAPQNTLAFIGLIQPVGSIMPISEMQARVFCAALAGYTTLPSSLEMWKKALQLNAINDKKFKTSRRHTLQVDYVNFMDQLAKMIKVRPSIPKYLITDPKLAYRLIFYGLVPYQYRLEGPYKWSEARKNILEFNERVFQCTRTRVTAETSQSKPNSQVFNVLSLLR